MLKLISRFYALAGFGPLIFGSAFGLKNSLYFQWGLTDTLSATARICTPKYDILRSSTPGRWSALQFRDGARDALDPLCQSFQGGRD